MRFTSIRPIASDWLGGNMNRCVVAVRGASTLLRRGLFLLILAGVPTTLGCGNEAPSSAARPSPPPGPENQFRLRQALASPPGTNRGQLQSGEDCEAGGRAACRGGFCLHVGLRPDDHFVCATSCVSDDDCPDERARGQAVVLRAANGLPTAPRRRSTGTATPSRALPSGE